MEDTPLERIQCLLREKFLSEIDTVQRRVSGDPDSWSPAKLDEARKEIEGALQALKVTDALTVDGNGEEQSHNLGRFCYNPVHPCT